jgi:hypothetical protein
MSRPQHATLGRDELCTLRRAAAMAHTVGAISLRLSAGGTTIVDVVPAANSAPLDRWRAARTPGARIDPCGFRTAVGRAWEDHRAGRHVGLVGLSDAAAEPLTVTWTVGAPGKLIGFGAVRAMCATRMIWAFASVLAPEALAELLAGFAADGVPQPAMGDDLAAKLIHDDVLEATVVHVEASCLGPRDPPTSSTVRVLDEVLRRMLAAVGAAEVIDELNCRQL